MPSEIPSQPPQGTAYTQPANPVTANPSEEHQQQQQPSSSSSSYLPPTKTDEHRHNPPQTTRQADSLPTSLAYGNPENPGPGEERHGATKEQMGRHRELEGEQMRAPGEGSVAHAVEAKEGASMSGKGMGFEEGIERKKNEQAEAREAVKEARKHGNMSDDGAGPRGETVV